MTIVYWLESLAISIWYLQFVTGNQVLLISSMHSGASFISLSTAWLIGPTVIDFWSPSTPLCLAPNIRCFWAPSMWSRQSPWSFVGLSYFTCEMSQGVGVHEFQCSGTQQPTFPWLFSWGFWASHALWLAGPESKVEVRKDTSRTTWSPDAKAPSTTRRGQALWSEHPGKAGLHCNGVRCLAPHHLHQPHKVNPNKHTI